MLGICDLKFMHISNLISISFRGLLTNKSRSLLTILGIVVGIMSVILMLSLGQGAKGLIINEVASFGANTLFVEPGPGDQNGPPIGIDMEILKFKDIEAIRKLPGISHASGVVFRDATVVYKEEDKRMRIVGALPDEQVISNAVPSQGRFFSDDEVKERSRVAVVGSEVAEQLFNGGADSTDGIGETIRIGKSNFRVIGVMAEQGTRFFQNFDNQIYVPLTAAQDVFGVNYVNYVSALGTGNLDVLVDEVRVRLRELHAIDNPAGDLSKDPFRVSTQVEATQTVGVITSALTALLASIAAISLVVGGIGIMNIMLVSVVERTREIGLRKAIGARSRDVLRQFLLEAVFLTLGGGVIGMALGIGFSFVASLAIRRQLSGWVFEVPLYAVVLAVSVSVGVGLVFGYYPARRAARLDPIEALRYE